MFKSWKSTFAGIGAAGLNLFANGMGWKQILLSLGLGVLGAVAKDYNVSGTGGTTVVR